MVLFLTSQAQAVPQPDGWKTYVDEQYGTRVEYPSWFSIREGEPALGPGERLVTPDKRAEIEIYSLPNQARHTPRSYLDEKMRLNPLMLHYERVTPRFFVLSAAANDRIYYTRCNFSERAGGTIHCVYLGYSQSEKRDWDQIVTHVSPLNRGAGTARKWPNFAELMRGALRSPVYSSKTLSRI
jgi:hypothetical protein